MENAQPQVIVAGHICLDIIPALAIGGRGAHTLADLLKPGALVEAGPAVLATGGAVSNTGLALHRLGIATRLMGKIGDDLFGAAIRRLLEAQGRGLADGLIVAPGEHTSYTIVISAAGVDRAFLHCPGANDTFGAADVPGGALAGARIFHFGYPPVMRRMYADGGRELVELFRGVRERGLITSLDMAMPDPQSDAGRVDWRELLTRVLPHVDLFVPSLDEMQFMLGAGRDPKSNAVSRETLDAIADWVIQRGAAVVALKLGSQGFYVRITAERDRLAPLRPVLGDALERWVDNKILAPCFAVDVVGTTGAGDCTVAGFLAGLLRGLPPEEAVTAAVAVGACSVEQADAVSGVPPWEAVQARIRAGWRRRPS